ncbi:MAG TPA: TRAP transporter large permease subunit [Pseudolabrys sp.]|jgi:tripartite ATP-independent transporter DctM subunit|nr:TRAP transporter large permease subunit [Pseudolabrys sp.]
MEWYISLTLVMGSFLSLVVIGVPIVFALFSVTIVSSYFLMGGASGVELLIDSIYNSLTVFVLLPITLFILMGEVMFRSGIAMQMIDTIDQWMGRLPGRMSLLAVASGAVLATLSGASIGSTAMLGSTLAPSMEKRGYRKPMILGPILGSGGLAIMIPPSGLGVILAVLANVSVGKLLIAIIIPGILMALMYSAYIVSRCTLDPSLAPSYEVKRTPVKLRLLLTFKYVVPLSFLIFLVTGMIFVGVATPTEAAALGAAGAFVVAFCYQGLSRKVTAGTLENTLRISVMVLVILAASQSFSQILAFTGATRVLVAWASSLPVPPIVVIIAMQAVVFVLGGFINGVPLMMITLPIFMPVVTALHYDPIWFCVIMLINVETAQLTPPFGILLFVMKGVASPDTTMMQIIGAAMPFIIMNIVAMGLLMLFPAIALYLPSLM